MSRRKYVCDRCGKVVFLNEEQTELARKIYLLNADFVKSLKIDNTAVPTVVQTLQKVVKCCDSPCFSTWMSIRS